MMAAARSMSLVLGTGYVLAFFSETVFWSVWRPGDEFHGRILTWLLYSLFAYLTLAVIRHFRVGDGRVLLLAGAFFGWLCEGVYAMTVFGDPSMPFPFTIVWTALAWHGPISLLVGWYALGLALREARPGSAMLLSLGIGLFWGCWALGWLAEAPPVAVPLLDFMLHAGLTTALLALAHLAIAAGGPASYAPSRIGLVLVGGVVFAFFAAVTVPAIPFAVLVLPPLLGLLWLVLWRGRALRPKDSLLARFAAPIQPWSLAALALIPVSASAVYAIAIYAAVSEALPPLGFVHPLFAATTSLVGLVLFGLAVATAMRRT
jgi:hypothetical protein